MNKSEALKILNLSDDASEKDIKKQFRKLAKEKHPDKNKDPNAESEYKTISEAYEYLKNPPPEPEFDFPNVQWTNFNDVLNSFFGGRPPGVRRPKVPDIHTSITLTFIESVTGCTKNININRNLKCPDCKLSKCSDCNGAGSKTSATQQGGVVVTNVRPCAKCSGSGNAKSDKNCTTCNNTGRISSESKLDVKIEGGILNGQKIRLNNVGNYTGTYNDSTFHSSMDDYTDVYITVNVEFDSDMQMTGNGNVISIMDISLYEAIKGTEKQVRTAYGEKTLKIKPNTKHTEKVTLVGCGAQRSGNHIFNINVNYPKDTTKLIEYLEKEQNGI